MILDTHLGALVCSTTWTNVRRLDRSAPLKTRRRTIILRVDLTGMDQDRIAYFAFHKNLKSVLAVPHRIRTLPVQSKNNSSRRFRFAGEKIQWLAFFLTDDLPAKHLNYLLHIINSFHCSRICRVVRNSHLHLHTNGSLVIGLRELEERVFILAINRYRHTVRMFVTEI